MPTPSLKSLEKALELLGRVAHFGDTRSISALAAEIGMPPSTAHRISATFERCGLITRVRRGHYLPGPTLLRLASPGGLNRVLAATGREVVKGLARQTGCTAHLGVWESGMVTYLVKAGRGRANIFTKEGTQLEAYCTGIGKVLLADLPKADLDEYLAQGPFVRLMPNTLTNAHALRAALDEVQARGYATDDAEMDIDLICLAVPVRDNEGRLLAALSIAVRQANAGPNDLVVHLESLRVAAKKIAHRLAPPSTESGPHKE
jgi:IclR family transcriptional regulator, acetate operon repressor